MRQPAGVQLPVSVGTIHTCGVRSVMSENNANCLIPWPVVLTLRCMPPPNPLSEESLYFLFPFKFSLSLLALMTTCHRLNVESNLLLTLEEMHLTYFDGC